MIFVETEHFCLKGQELFSEEKQILPPSRIVLRTIRTVESESVPRCHCRYRGGSMGPGVMM